MKKIFWLWALGFGLWTSANAQISYVNTTTPSTNTVTSSGVISIPGQFTNAYSTRNTNSIIIGDLFSTAFGKVNSDIYFLWNFLGTNDWSGANFGGTASNAIPIYNGGGTNLTVTNTFTLVGTTPYYTIGSLNGTFPDPNPYPLLCTNTAGPYFPSTNLPIGVATNACGFTNFYSVTCTNDSGPYFLNTNNYPIPVLTNACGFTLLTNHTCTNSSGAYTLASNIATNAYTNSCGFVIFGSGPCPSQKGPYYPSPSLGTGAMTNACGDIIYNFYPSACTNTAGPYFLNTNYPVPVLTNACGFIVATNYTCTNSAGPYNLYTNLGNGTYVYTNACGFEIFGNEPCPNADGPYYPAPQYGPRYFTNACGYVMQIFAAQTNYTYAVSSIVATNNGNGDGAYSALDAAYLIFTNIPFSVIYGEKYGDSFTLKTNSANSFTFSGHSTNGNFNFYFPITNTISHRTSLKLSSSYSAAVSGTYSISQYVIINGVTNQVNASSGSGSSGTSAGNNSLFTLNPDITNVVIDYFNFSVSGGHFDWSATFNNIFNPGNYFAYYATNAWRFYSADQVSFSNNETITITGNSSNIFYVTNVTRLPDTNILYTTSAGGTAQFYDSLLGGWYLDANGDIVTFGDAPLPGQIIVIVTPPPPTNSPTNSPPVPPSGPGGGSGCTTYVTVTINGVRKYLPDGIAEINDAALHNGVGQIAGCNHFDIDASGNASLYLNCNLAAHHLWNDDPGTGGLGKGGWTTQIPPDACPSDFPAPSSTSRPP